MFLHRLEQCGDENHGYYYSADHVQAFVMTSQICYVEWCLYENWAALGYVASLTNCACDVDASCIHAIYSTLTFHSDIMLELVLRQQLRQYEQQTITMSIS